MENLHSRPNAKQSALYWSLFIRASAVNWHKIAIPPFGNIVAAAVASSMRYIFT